MSNDVGKLVRAKRKELNLTQARLAELMGSDEYYISAIETGRRKPGGKFLVALSNALGVPVDSLLGLESNVVLGKKTSELELKLLRLNPSDREILLDIFNTLADRFLSEKK